MKLIISWMMHLQSSFFIQMMIELLELKIFMNLIHILKMNFYIKIIKGQRFKEYSFMVKYIILKKRKI